MLYYVRDDQSQPELWRTLHSTLRSTLQPHCNLHCTLHLHCILHSTLHLHCIPHSTLHCTLHLHSPVTSCKYLQKYPLLQCLQCAVPATNSLEPLVRRDER